jgi:hypothetical protein
MLPLSSSRSSTLPISNFSYLASLDAERDVLEIAEQRHVGDFGRMRHHVPARARPSMLKARAFRPAWRNDSSNVKPFTT